MITKTVWQVAPKPPPNLKIWIHFFFIEIKGKWYDLTSKIKELNEEKPLIMMDIEHLNVHCKHDSDYRKTQSYLDSHALDYTTLSTEKRPRGIFIRSISHPQLIVNDLNEHDLITNRAAILKKAEKLVDQCPYMLPTFYTGQNLDKFTKLKNICVRRFDIIKQC